MIWIILVLQASAAGPVNLGAGAAAYATEDACLREAELVRVRMAQVRMVVEVRCEVIKASQPR
jgi:hypothetical protein